MSKWWERAFRADLIFAYWPQIAAGASILTGLLTAWRATLEQLPLSVVILVGIWATVGVAALLYVFARWRQALKAGPVSNIENIETLVIVWADRRKWGIQRRDDPAASFCFDFTVHSGVPISVVRPKSDERVLLIGSGVTLSPAYIAVVNGLTQIEARRFITELKIELNRLALNYAGLSSTSPREIFVNRSLVITDQLTEFEFENVVSQILHAILLINHVLYLKLGATNAPIDAPAS